MTFDGTQTGGPKDPLPKAASDNGRVLFEKMAQVASGFSQEDVSNAAGNLLVNAIRQTCSTPQQADLAFDGLVARLKGLLLDQHYQNGRRRNVFPFHQVIHVPLIKSQNKF